MVVFVCSKCNETLKKKNVERHFYACRCPSVSCVDCSKSFTLQDFASHALCISEQEKYDKPNFQESARKGAQKQMDWTTFLHSRLRNFQTPSGVPTLMKRKILASTNVPRKKAKFEFARPEDIDALWQQITRRDIDAGNAVSRALSTDDTKPSNGLNHANQSERSSVKDEGGPKTLPSHLSTQKSGDDDAYEKCMFP
ncbi:unnamed protein product [Taenia asiatica]|uniref:Zf-LYAR domain-containing protein n=1 Tax=Taenia asiatica TaxID=60517 RepID=A0A0R3WC69_TAEAS|nr:unnamed protein product [Taenia asiatica]